MYPHENLHIAKFNEIVELFLRIPKDIDEVAHLMI